MIEFKITGQEAGDELIQQLVGLRHYARRIRKGVDAAHELRKHWERLSEHAPDGTAKATAIGELARLGEERLQFKSVEIEIGQYTLALSKHLDQKADRERVLDALNVGLAARRSEEIKEHGDSTANLIYVLGLEDLSERSGEDWGIGPLAWCCQMAFMREIPTNTNFDRAAHEVMNETFNGAFCEFRERTLIERLAGQGVKA